MTTDSYDHHPSEPFPGAAAVCLWDLQSAQIKRAIQKKKQICTRCGTSVSPRWRKGPAGRKSMCNACGIRYLEILRRENKIPKTQNLDRVAINALLNPPSHAQRATVN